MLVHIYMIKPITKTIARKLANIVPILCLPYILSYLYYTNICLFESALTDFFELLVRIVILHKKFQIIFLGKPLIMQKKEV